MKNAMTALVLLLCAVSAPALTLQHGHLADIDSYVDSNTGRTVTSETHAFLAIKLPYVPPDRDFVDYGQRLSPSSNVTYTASEFTTAATIDRWIILPVQKPCPSGFNGFVSVGRIAVCPPRNWAGAQEPWGVGYFYACAPENEGRWGYVAPVWVGIPPEKAKCGEPFEGSPGSREETPEV